LLVQSSGTARVSRQVSWRTDELSAFVLETPLLTARTARIARNIRR
jgi:hypothetical protein